MGFAPSRVPEVTDLLVLAALSGIALDGFEPDKLATSFIGLLIFLALGVTVFRWVLDRLFRYVMASGSSTTAAVSITLVVITTLVVIKLGARIYRGAVLSIGRKVRLREAFRAAAG